MVPILTGINKYFNSLLHSLSSVDQRSCKGLGQWTWPNQIRPDMFSVRSLNCYRAQLLICYTHRRRRALLFYNTQCSAIPFGLWILAFCPNYPCSSCSRHPHLDGQCSLDILSTVAREHWKLRRRAGVRWLYIDVSFNDRYYYVAQGKSSLLIYVLLSHWHSISL